MSNQGIIKDINLNLDINARKRVEGKVDIKLYSKDVESGHFNFVLRDEDNKIVILDDAYKGSALIKFQSRATTILREMEVIDNSLRLVFPHDLITSDDTCTIYIYVTKNNITSDVASITFDTRVSEIDKHIGNIEEIEVVGKDKLVKEIVEIINDGVRNVIKSETTVIEADLKQIKEHALNAENPHNVTKIQLELGNVDNVKQASKIEFDEHATDKENPHAVTKAQVGLANVENLSLATQVEAEAGTSNDKYMSPLRTKQAIDKTKELLVWESGDFKELVEALPDQGIFLVSLPNTDNLTNFPERDDILGFYTSVTVRINRSERYAGYKATGLILESLGMIYIAAVGDIFGDYTSVAWKRLNPATIATQSEAESGKGNTKMMTPERTKQAIDKFSGVPQVLSWEGALIEGAPSAKYIFTVTITNGDTASIKIAGSKQGSFSVGLGLLSDFPFTSADTQKYYTLSTAFKTWVDSVLDRKINRVFISLKGVLINGAVSTRISSPLDMRSNIWSKTMASLWILYPAHEIDGYTDTFMTFSVDF